MFSGRKNKPRPSKTSYTRNLKKKKNDSQNKR